MLWPHGVLFRDSERKIRAATIESDIIEGVIGLGPNLFYNSPMEACVVVINKAKPKRRRGQVVFVNAVNLVTRERAQSFLSGSDLAAILAAWESPRKHPEIARVVPLEEIRTNRHNLSIPLYVTARQADAGEGQLESAIEAWQEGRSRLREHTAMLLKALASIGYK